MGSEIYVHFAFERGEELTGEAAAELRELEEDAGTQDVPRSGASGDGVARVDPESDVRAGRRARLWLNTDKIHLFARSDGSSLTADAVDAAA